MIANLVVAVHVLSVFVLVAGILGRNITHRMVVRATELPLLVARHEVSSAFEMIVRSGSLFVLLTGLGAAWARGWPVLGFLQGAGSNWVLVSLLVYISIIPLIVLVFLPRGRVFQAALAEATAQGAVTPALRASLADPVIGAARAYELIMIATLTVLMVAKPF